MAVELYDEHEQSERVRNWLRENGVSILMGVALALAGIFGWRQWLDYQSGQAVLANEYYAAIQQELEVGRTQAAAEQFAAMREGVGEHAYLALSGMLVAAAWTEAGDIEKAAGIYRDLLDSDKWDVFQPLLRLRMAQVEIALEQGDSALTLLQGSVPAGYEGLWLETRGDVLFDMNRLEEAADAYAAAVMQLRGEGRDFRQAEIKLDAVQSAIGRATVEQAAIGRSENS
ncbi:MAG TPA: tetratricopeptide repeat protein [Wenzhouxiangellaceae bacterium]|nr:tetratricopeptide repeat protein [Wenzhouxiangellaceae bacterium]